MSTNVLVGAFLCFQVLFCLKFGFFTCTALVYSFIFGHCVKYTPFKVWWTASFCHTDTCFKWLRFFDVDWNWGGAVGGGTRLQAGQSWFWFPPGADCLLWSAQTSCEDCLAFCSAGIGGGFFARSKAVNHSLPSNAEVKNDWSCTSTPFLYVPGMGRDNFIFNFTLPFTVPFAILWFIHRTYLGIYQTWKWPIG